MKKLIMSLWTIAILLGAVPAESKTTVRINSTTLPAEKPDESARAQVLLSRLDEINALDKSAMNASEKKQLRKEVRTIKKELKAISGGVYLSVAAIIIIILLLILLL